MSKILIIKEATEKAIATESSRTAQLLRRAELLGVGIIIVTGFQMLDIRSQLESSSLAVKVTCCASLAVLSCAMFFAIRGMGLKGYATYPRGQKLWENLKPETVTEDMAEEAIIQVLLETRETNARLNNSKVKALFWCGWLLFAGFLLVVGSQFLDVYMDSLSA